jgi:hypothetical protein
MLRIVMKPRFRHAFGSNANPQKCVAEFLWNLATCSGSSEHSLKDTAALLSGVLHSIGGAEAVPHGGGGESHSLEPRASCCCWEVPSPYRIWRGKFAGDASSATVILRFQEEPCQRAATSSTDNCAVSQQREITAKDGGEISRTAWVYRGGFSTFRTDWGSRRPRLRNVTLLAARKSRRHTTLACRRM